MSLKRAIVAAAVACAAALPPAAAQEGGLLLVEHFEVAPGDALAFEEVASVLVGAAETGGLDRARYGWWLWQDGFEYAVVFQIPSLGQLDDEMWWFEGFQGTAGEAGMARAFEMMADVDFLMTTEVLRGMPSLSYTPAQPRQARYARVIEEWVDPGSAPAYQEFVGGMAPWLEEAGYPFQVATHTTAVGPQRWVFVVFYDDPAEFAEIEVGFMESPDHDEMVRRWGPMILDYEESRYRYRADLSYAPDGM